MGNGTLLSTEHARSMLSKRYTAPEWALMEEVAPNTGGGTTYADAVAVNLWKSRGHAIHGFEIKVSRSDWLRELKKPAKAEGVFSFCDYWWIVAPTSIVRDGELPPTWGLLELRARGLVVQAKAPHLDPKPISRGFFASLMRRGTECIERTAARMHAQDRDRMHGESEARIKKEIEARSRRHSELHAAIAEIESKTGLKILEKPWQGPPIEAIQLAQRLHALSAGYGDTRQMLGRLSDLAGDLERAARVVRDAVAATEIERETADV
jgi:hypothetical protein